MQFPLSEESGEFEGSLSCSWLLQAAAAGACCRYGGRGCFPEFTNPCMHPCFLPCNAGFTLLHQTCPAPGPFCTRSVLHQVYTPLCQIYSAPDLSSTRSFLHQVFLDKVYLHQVHDPCFIQQLCVSSKTPTPKPSSSLQHCTPSHLQDSQGRT